MLEANQLRATAVREREVRQRARRLSAAAKNYTRKRPGLRSRLVEWPQRQRRSPPAWAFGLSGSEATGGAIERRLLERYF